MPTDRQIRDRVDAFVADRLAEIEPRQDAYFAERGRYCQVLPTHTEPVRQREETVGTRDDTTADRLTTRPTDQAETTRDFIGTTWDGLDFPARVTINVYESRRGHGYFVVVECKIEDEDWTRSVGYGPEAATFTRAWEKVEPDEDTGGTREEVRNGTR
jgi:hypothetical protein